MVSYKFYGTDKEVAELGHQTVAVPAEWVIECINRYEKRANVFVALSTINITFRSKSTAVGSHSQSLCREKTLFQLTTLTLRIDANC